MSCCSSVSGNTSGSFGKITSGLSDGNTHDSKQNCQVNVEKKNDIRKKNKKNEHLILTHNRYQCKNAIVSRFSNYLHRRRTGFEPFHTLYVRNCRVDLGMTVSLFEHVGSTTIILQYVMLITNIIPSRPSQDCWLQSPEKKKN